MGVPNSAYSDTLLSTTLGMIGAGSPVLLLHAAASRARPKTATVGAAQRAGGGDRKSTRLNSSHSQISYAVFCLKKNRTDTQHTRPMQCTRRSHPCPSS